MFVLMFEFVLAEGTQQACRTSEYLCDFEKTELTFALQEHEAVKQFHPRCKLQAHVWRTHSRANQKFEDAQNGDCENHCENEGQIDRSCHVSQVSVAG